MARRIRIHNWAGTPLGPIERWPVSLRNALTTILDHPLPMALGWGPELIAFYNDAYTPLLGGKADALGRPFLDVWDEARDTIAPQITEALAGKPCHFENARFTLVRGDEPEEAFFDYSYIPMRDETGAVAGMLNTAIETTGRVRAERERGLAELALRDSEERFRSVSDSDVFAIAFFDTGGAITGANDAFLNLVGYTRSELQAGAVRWDLLTPPEWMPQTQEAVRQYQRTGRIEPYEKEYFRKNGERFWGLFGGRRIESSGEGVAFVLDITERKRAEAVLRESEERQAFLLRLSDAIRPLSDPQEIQQIAVKMTGEHFHANRAGFAEIVGDEIILHCDYTAGVRSIVGKYPKNVFGEGIAKLYFESGVHLSNDVANDPSFSETDKQGLRSFDVAAFLGSTLHRESGLLLGFALHQATPRVWTQAEVALAEEVSNRVWAAVVSARAEAALRESEQNLRGVANVVPDLLWYSVPDGSTAWYNDRWLEYTGQTLEQASGWGWLDAIHPDDREGSIRRYREAVEQSKPLQQEHRLQNAAGAYRWFLVRAEPLRDADGQVTRMYGAATDIDDRRLAMEALRESEERQAFLLKLADELRSIADPIRVQELAAQMTGEYLRTNRVAYAITYGDFFQIEAGWEKGIPPMVGRFDVKVYGDYLIAGFHAGRTIVSNDTAHDRSLSEAERSANVSAGVGSYIGVPLVKNNRWAATFAIHNIEPRQWTSSEISLAQEVAERTWAAMERARAEAALSESEERYHALFAASPVPFMVLDANPPHYTILAANDAYFTATKTTRETLIGRKLFDVFTDDPSRPGQLGSEALDISLAKVLATQKTDVMPRVRYDLVVPGGFEPHWWEAINAPVLNDAGRITTIIHQVARVTELHLAEVAEEQNLERQAFLLKLSDALRPLSDPVEIQRVASHLLGEYLKVLRAGYGEVEGSELVVRADYTNGVASMTGRYPVDAFGQALAKAYREGGTTVVRDARTDPSLSGAERQQLHALKVAALVTVVMRKAGQPTISLGVQSEAPRGWTSGEIALIQEIAERTWAVVARARAEQAVREGEERFRFFVQNVREYALVQTDLESIIVSWNPGAEGLFQYTSAEVVGKPFVMLLPEEDRHEGIIAREMARLSEGKTNVDAHWVQRKDGSRFWAEWITEPVFDDAGKLRGTAKVMRDETERQKAQAALESSLAEKESLLGEVHHRVKNNLQVITSLLSLQSRGLKDEEVLSLFNETRNRVESIASIHELLYRSSNFASVDLLAYAQQLVPSLVRFYGAQHRIHVRIEGEGARLELERAVPFGLLLNELVSNSLKHGFSEANSGSLRVALHGTSEAILLTVEDSGKGLPRDFQPDKQTSLGLRLVHILVKQLSGQIAFHCNSGTSVSVTIPIRSGRQTDANRRSTSLQDTDR